MKITVKGENPFKAVHSTFTVAGTSNGFTLSYSTSPDKGFTNYSEPTPANEVLIVNGATPFTYFKLTGNTDDVEVIL